MNLADEIKFLRSVGGKQGIRAGGDPLDPADIAWNFGMKPEVPLVGANIAAKASFHDRFPKLKGKWDGKTTINGWKVIEKVLKGKAEDLIHYQPRGTCGGRAGAFGGDFVQCAAIAAGKRAKFKSVSHAAVYYAARKKYNMIGGDWRDDDNDGVAHGSVPAALAEMGLANREETNDSRWYGDGSDDLACQLAAGMHPELARKILEVGADNLLTEWCPITSAAEAADAIASGGVVIGSDSQGFTMQRDQDGFCSPRGTWQHYHARCSVLGQDSGRGRKGFAYNQSWSKTVPGGNPLPDHPGNCFGVDWNVQDRLCRTGRYAALFLFPLWDLENDNIDISWTF